MTGSAQGRRKLSEGRMGKTTEFKRCSCKRAWKTREEFVLDPDIAPIGISFPADESSFQAYYYFNHGTCQTTLVVDSEDFADLIETSIPPTIKAGTPECKGHCTKKKSLELCSTQCRNAPFRRFFIEHILAKKI